MTTPAWLQAMALLAWAATLGQGLPGMALGVVLAGLRLLAGLTGLRLQLDERGLNRSVDASAVVVAGSLAALLAAQGLPNGLLTAMGWLPVTLLPLLLIAGCNETPLRLRHLALSLRGSTRPEAALPIDPQAPYLAITLLAGAVLARSSAWAFGLLGGILLAWLFVSRPPPCRRDWALFAGSAALALGLAFVASQGLQRAHLALQDWVADRLAGADSDPYQSQTRIGDLGRVKLSERIVWRLRQTPPIEVPLLLRTSVFTRYANGTWLAQHDAFAAMPEGPAGAVPRLLLRGDSQQGTALLPVPAGIGAISTAGRLERNALGVVRLSAAPALLQIAIGKTEQAVAPPDARDLALPTGFGAVLDQLPELAALRSASPQQQLAGLSAWFGEHFRYTLFIGDEAGGRRDLQRFLLGERAGHCEYFASATVLLLRALGIPARYVTGYSVQEYSRLEQAFVVRSRHAHAWSEAFVDGRWIEVDTTPATWLGIEEDAAPWWRPAADLGSFIWRRLGELRREAFAGDHIAAGWGSAALLLLLLLWFGRRHWRGAIRTPGKVGSGDTANAPPSAEVQAFHSLEQQFAELGLGRHAGEAPRIWLTRLAIEGCSVIDAAGLLRAQQVIEALYRQRYALLPTADENPLQTRA